MREATQHSHVGGWRILDDVVNFSYLGVFITRHFSRLLNKIQNLELLKNMIEILV